MAKRGTAADNSFTPAEVERLFATGSRIDESQLDERLEGVSITMAFLTYLFGVLGVRLGFALHFDETHVDRDSNGEIVAITVPTYAQCDSSFGGAPCKHCQKLAKARAANDDDDDTTPEDYYDEYWSPKSSAGNRSIPVMQERGKEIIDLFLKQHGELNMSAETVRRRLTRLAEVTDGINPDQMMPQSLRASAARFWMNWREFDVDALQILMGWKYLSTANYYLPSTFQKLQHTMARCLNKSPSPAYDVTREPTTYAKIRDNKELVHIGTVTPEGEVTRHKFADQPNPLEAEAEEYQSKFDEEGYKSNIPEPVTTMCIWITDMNKQIEERLHTWWSRNIDYAPLEWSLQTRPRQALLMTVMIIPTLLWFGAELAAAGLWVDISSQSASISTEPLVAIMISAYVIHRDISDEFEDVIEQFSWVG